MENEGILDASIVSPVVCLGKEGGSAAHLRAAAEHKGSSLQQLLLPPQAVGQRRASCS